MVVEKNARCNSLLYLNLCLIQGVRLVKTKIWKQLNNLLLHSMTHHCSM